MIKINLYVGKKPFKIPKVLGIDIAALNWKGLIIVYLLSYLPALVFETPRQDELGAINTEVEGLNAELRQLKKKARDLEDIEKEIQALEQKEKALNSKLDIVRELLKSKKNPMKFLLYISKNIPEDLWVNSLRMVDNRLEIEGESASYKSIGIFFENLKKATFFSGVSLNDTKTISAENNIRRESFKLSLNVTSF